MDNDNFYLITASKELGSVPAPVPNGFKWMKEITFCMQYSSNDFPTAHVVEKAIQAYTRDTSRYTIRAISWVSPIFAKNYNLVEIVSPSNVPSITPNDK